MQAGSGTNYNDGRPLGLAMGHLDEVLMCCYLLERGSVSRAWSDKAAITLVQYAIKEDFRGVFLLEECADFILIILTQEIPSKLPTFYTTKRSQQTHQCKTFIITRNILSTYKSFSTHGFEASYQIRTRCNALNTQCNCPLSADNFFLPLSLFKRFFTLFIQCKHIIDIKCPRI